MQSLEKQDSYEIGSFEGGLTVSKALGGTMLSNVLKQVGKPNLIKSLSYIILRASKNFNLKNNLTEDQAITIAFDFMDKYKFENIEDVVLMFKLARQGMLGGKVWRIDSEVILGEWMPAYLELKAIEREKVKTQNKEEFLKLDQSVSEKSREELNKMLDRLKKPKKSSSHGKLTYDLWLEKLPESCKSLTKKELLVELKKVKSRSMTLAINIYQNELKNRK